ncbi:MAG: GTP-binding protein [Variibacter sp.]|nr:GTP-binding protein [Variibacter sp.]
MLELFPARTIGPFGRRQRHARGGKIPVTVVTGFLGAGKTTLVRRFLATEEGRGTAVVVNEFGAEGIDDALIRTSTDETVLLGNGCLCCTARTDLQVALRALVADRARGAVPHFRRVVIETSGLADPGPVLQTFATDRALGGEFHLELAVALVDAETALATLAWSAEARKQVILADRLIVTKVDVAGTALAERVEERLRALNPHAPIERAIFGRIDPQSLVAAPAPPMAGGAGARGFVAEAAHSDGIASFVLAQEAPMPWAPFARAMDVLTSLRGPDLLRVKGFVAVEGCQGPVLVQFVQHLADAPVELQAWPDGRRGTRLVFITRNLPERVVRDLFAAVQAVAAPP